MYDLILEDATIVSSSGRQVADIAIRRGRIAYVGPRPGGRARETINAIGRFVMPGIIDSLVCFPGDGEETSWESESRAAVSGGVTTVLDLPAGVRTARVLGAHRKLARSQSRCNFGFWAPADVKPSSLARMLSQGAIGVAVDLSSPSAPAEPELRRLFEESEAMLGFLVEDRAALLSDATAADLASYNAARPPAAAASGVQQLISLVREFDRPAHVFQLSTANELVLLDPIGGELPISAAVSPHHLSLSVEHHEGRSELLKCTPPIRSETDRRALWTALKRNRIDTIASAHTPLSAAGKSALPFPSSPPGLPGVETTFSLMLSAVQHGRLSLERMVELLVEAPASIFQLPQKGAIKVGADADMVLFSESGAARLERSSLLSASGWSPFEGRELAPKPELVIVGGQVVARGGQIVDDSVRGTEVKPARRAR